MVEKRVPHYDLRAIQQLFSTPEDLRITTSAISDAAAINYGFADIVRVIQSMGARHFYKSMTANANPRAWQDVYHVPDGRLVLYVKFTDNAVEDLKVLSFKEK
jgi:motility quorum-sensing regulator / GCU-specific mRNA interferase toxin